jgi:hypothetical protein
MIMGRYLMVILVSASLSVSYNVRKLRETHRHILYSNSPGKAVTVLRHCFRFPIFQLLHPFGEDDAGKYNPESTKSSACSTLTVWIAYSKFNHD